MPQISRQTGTSLSEINIVPFVDVMLVLLIIFMITAPILQSGIEVNLPKTQTVKEISDERVVVTIDRGQLIYLGNDAVNIHDLGNKVRAQMRNPQTDAVFSALRRDGAVRHVRHGDRYAAAIGDRKRERGDRAAERAPQGTMKPVSNGTMTMQQPGLKGPLLWSLILHSALVRFAGGVDNHVPSRRSVGRAGRRWRGFREVGGRTGQGVPLPRPESVTTNRVVDESKGLYKSEPKPKPQEIAAGCHADSEVHQREAAAIRHPPFQDAGRPNASTAKRSALWAGRLARGALFAIRDGSGSVNTGGHAVRRGQAAAILAGAFPGT